MTFRLTHGGIRTRRYERQSENGLFLHAFEKTRKVRGKRETKDIVSIICRRAESKDIPRAIAIRSLASSEVKAQYGFGTKKTGEATTPDPFYAFSMEHEPEGFWIAEDRDQIVGMMIAWVRETFWFLSYLFVAPGCQDRKVGKHLLNAAFQNGASTGIVNRALITYAYNAGSIGFYMKYKMFSRESIYKMVRSTPFVRPHGDRYIPAGVTRLERNKESIEALASIDRNVLGFSRGKHHEFFLRRTDVVGYLFRNGKDVLGYSYIWDDGQIGPLGAASEGAFSAILETSLAFLSETESAAVSLLVPGSNASAVSIVLQHGFRVAEPYVLMATKPFGKWNQYLFHSPPLL